MELNNSNYFMNLVFLALLAIQTRKFPWLSMAFSKDIITSLSNQVIGFKLLWAFKIFLALLMPREKFQSAFATFHKPHTISKALQARNKIW